MENHSDQSGSSKKTLRVGINTPVVSLDPRHMTDFVNVLVPWQIYETLYSPVIGDKPAEPLLLKEPLQNESPAGGRAVYSAAMRQGVKFSDGTPMTTQHIVDSLKKNKTFSSLAEVMARGERIYFFLNRPDPRFELALTTLNRAVILDKNNQVLGTGAYVPAPDSTPDRMRLVRNPHYWRKVSISEIEFRVFSRGHDGNAELLRKAIKDGWVDFTTCLNRDEVSDLFSVKKSIKLGASTALLYFNTERPVFQDRRVRKAVAMTIDRYEIAKLFYSNPYAYIASGILPPFFDRIPDGIQHDLEKATELLAEADFKPPSQPLSLLLIWGPRPYLPDPPKAAEVMVQHMSKLGFAVKIQPASNLSEYFERTERGNYDMVLAGWIADTPSSADFLEIMLSSEYIPSAAGSVMSRINLSRWKNPQMDQALKRYRDEPSKSNIQEIARLLHEEMPVFPIVYGTKVVVHSWRLKNIPQSILIEPLFFAEMDLKD